MSNDLGETIDAGALERKRYHGRQSVLQLIGESALFADAFRFAGPKRDPQAAELRRRELNQELLAGCTSDEVVEVKKYFSAWADKIAARSGIQARGHEGLRSAGSLLAEARLHRACFIRHSPDIDETARADAIAKTVQELSESPHQTGLARPAS